MSNEITKEPEIRFDGYEGDWEERKLKDILKTHSFRSYLADISENGEYEVIQQGDKPIVGYSDGKPFTNYKDITLFGDHTVSLYKPKRPFFVATDGVKILSADNFEGDYLYTTLERYKPEPQGYKRHFTILKNQDVWFTGNMEEQQKIGTFFKQLDKTIALHQRELDLLEQTKQTYLKKMFPKTGEDKPEIRFAGFTDAWEQRKLGEVATRVTRKNKKLESTLPLTISAQFGLVDQNTFFNKQIASKDVSGYYLLKKGEFAYNKSYSNGYPWGAVKRLDKYDMGVLSTLYICFRPVDINSDFLASYYDTDRWYKEVSKHAAEGARNHGLLNIAASDFFETELMIPKNNNEQEKIADFFKSLDTTITLHQRELDSLKEMKKTLLQKMFV
ncbi:restriction endonuclease subunit S [Enterococcus gallinarum]|jgi:type I restriction enzyme, S subunit|uniref:restriction endonuclease subunit S n=1 Tax=Enterococcus TaxID=1350 RepID=UPI0016186778|nr:MULTISPECIES: restriction endonuclease subunit S [Enterococcus]MBB6643701.1 restriction endonuclease subunit S [Enterococcus faecalis]MDT2697936.1 restriction endonuclease subunit S [Enterococcus gallinarum]